MVSDDSELVSHTYRTIVLFQYRVFNGTNSFKYSTVMCIYQYCILFHYIPLETDGMCVDVDVVPDGPVADYYHRSHPHHHSALP